MATASNMCTKHTYPWLVLTTTTLKADKKAVAKVKARETATS
jgi:hypothetical protein